MISKNILQLCSGTASCMASMMEGLPFMSPLSTTCILHVCSKAEAADAVQQTSMYFQAHDFIRNAPPLM